jgi:ATP-dependent DNA helicase RecG
VDNSNMAIIENQVKRENDIKSLKDIRGIGPYREVLLHRLGVKTPMDLVSFFPRRYEDRSHVIGVRDAVFGESQLFFAEITSARHSWRKGGGSVFQLEGRTSDGLIKAAWFNSKYLDGIFKIGVKTYLYGKVIKNAGQVSLYHPDYEIVKDEEDRRVHTGRIIPFYALTQDLTPRHMRGVMYQLLVDMLGQIQDPLPPSIQKKCGLVNRRFAFKEIHFPSSVQSLEKAYKRLVFDEFFKLQITLAIRTQTRKIKVSNRITVDQAVLDKFKLLLPYVLTHAQTKAINDIISDFDKNHCMRRLLQGDVGSGKTTVAAFGMFSLALSGYQSVILAPTEILAQQHYLTLSRFFASSGIEVGLLTGSVEASERVHILKALKTGSCLMLVATHAVIQPNVILKNLKMIIIDEQHKFGVDQQKALREKAKEPPHELVMTATPIPRSLALTVFGDMDISEMLTKGGRKSQVETLWFSHENWPAIKSITQTILKKREQVFVVYPALKENSLDKLSAKDGLIFLQDEFPSTSIGLLHGQMKGADKKSVLAKYASGKIQLLVATTIVEVGIDVPNATLMLIMGAENFGLSQLHQLRGRVGRGRKKGVCVLVSNSTSDEEYPRLDAFVGTESGFELAEADLKLRGPGDIVGARQHGIPALRIGSLSHDSDTLAIARKEAFAYLNEDYPSQDAEYRHLNEFITQLKKDEQKN